MASVVVGRESDKIVFVIGNVELRRSLATKDLIASVPPVGHFQVTNIYVSPNDGKLIVNYDDSPSKVNF